MRRFFSARKGSARQTGEIDGTRRCAAGKRERRTPAEVARASVKVLRAQTVESDLNASPHPAGPESPGYLERLAQAADLWGIERDYWDIFGRHHFANSQVLRAILGSLGVDASTSGSLDAAIREQRAEHAGRLTPSTLVVFPGERVPVSAPADTAASVCVRLEDGSTRSFETRLPDSLLALPADLPLGYHQITVRTASHEVTSRLIVCPARAFTPADTPLRAAGIGVSLYGLRSARNWGCGDFTDLMAFSAWAQEALGANFVALNPLHAIANRAPYNTSPYLPTCSYYRNFIYIDVEAVPEFARSPLARRLLASGAAQEELATLREANEVQYERVSRLKLLFLRLAFREFLRERNAGTERAREFRAWAEREGDLLHRFAVHAALDEAMHRRCPDVWNWPGWPEPFRSPDSAETQEFARQRWRSVLFYEYVQWIADAQLARAQEQALSLGMTIGLYHDLALATDRFGADPWMLPRFFVHGCRVGAPPDDFSPRGQDWGFPPPNSEAHYRDGYRLFAESIRKVCRHGGALRIDHAMRFFRLFWIPDGMEAVAGTYVRERHEDLLRILALESVRNRVVIVGEDLGTVPDYVRETLSRYGILSYRLFYFEKERSGQFKPPSEYPRLALVSAATHDLPTLAGFWQNRDIEARRQAGVLPDDQSMRRAIDERMSEKQKILDLLHRLRLIPAQLPRNAARIPELTGDLQNAIVGLLMDTPSMLLLLNQEDLFKETDQQNLPGTTAEYPNWRRKMKYALEELRASPASDYAAMFRSWVEKTGRCGAATSDNT